MLKRAPSKPPRPDPEERILAAAIELFAAEGYASVAVPEVAARAGVGLGTLYQRFPSKEALGNAVFRRCKRAWAAATLDIWPEGEPPETQFRLYWERLSAFAEKHRDMALYNERNPIGHAYDAESLALREELDRRSEAVLRAWVNAGAVADLPFEVMAGLIHGSFQRILELSVPARQRQSLMDETGRAVWRALEKPD
ncbi:MAG: TetR/AcrR family transcriptional regulator [Parvibaculum sp.]|nr:TetR/AcrR family transcriptional regulator [Parvibaculum sp.]